MISAIITATIGAVILLFLISLFKRGWCGQIQSSLKLFTYHKKA
jgi:hypothetical protein